MNASKCSRMGKSANILPFEKALNFKSCLVENQIVKTWELTGISEAAAITKCSMVCKKKPQFLSKRRNCSLNTITIGVVCPSIYGIKWILLCFNWQKFQPRLFISVRTMRREFLRIGLHTWMRHVEKPLICARNVRICRQWSLERRNWMKEDCGKIMLSAE